MKSSLSFLIAAACTACAGGSSGAAPGGSPAPAAPAASATTAVMQQAAQAAQVAQPEPPKPKDIDPTGSYAVSLTYGGQPVSFTLELARQADGTYTGTIYVEQTPPIPLANITVNAKRVLASLTTPDGSTATMDFTIDGADVTGSWRGSNGDGSQLSGRKIP